MKKETFIVHTDNWESLEDLTLEQLGTLFMALIQNQREGPLPKMDKQTKMAFKFMSAQIERDNDKYNAIVEKRKAAAKARWSKEKMQMHKVQCLNDTDTVTDTDNDTDSERYVSLASLSPEEEKELHLFYGERAEQLIEDVRAYYGAHPEKPFPGWGSAVAQFDRNQQRWGRANTPKNIDDIMAMAFGGTEQ